MANYIKPFATNPDASVMTNDELANADELKRGFIPKSKADSRLIGKLIQNSTAGAYVLGEFTSSVGGVDVDPSNATTFSSDFQNALKTYITRHAPQAGGGVVGLMDPDPREYFLYILGESGSENPEEPEEDPSYSPVLNTGKLNYLVLA